MEAYARPMDHGQSDKRATQTGGGNGDLLDYVRSRLQVVRGPDARGDYTAWCIFHPDGKGKPPHQPNLHFSERGYKCFACGAGGSLRDLARALGAEAPGVQPEATYDYRDEQGTLLYQVVRYPGKRFFCRRPDSAGAWIQNLNGVRRVPYRLPDLLAQPEARVYVVEGEKDADVLAGLRLVAITNQGGAGKWRDDYSTALTDRDVVILPDNDGPGRKHADQVARSVVGVAKSVKVVSLPGVPPKGDVSDWLGAGHTAEELGRLAETTATLVPSPQLETAGGDREREQRTSQANRIIELLSQEGVTLFRDENSEPYARVPVDGHFEIWPCGSEHFKDWLSGLSWRRDHKALGSEAMSSALNVIRAKARFEGERHALHNRVAQVADAIWYDLSDERWRAVKVTADRVEVVAVPPILFRRHAHQAAQVDPAQDKGDLRDLLRFINIKDESQGLLLLVYLVSCFVPEIPHPILAMHGPQGSAKTTALRMLRLLVDPSTIEVLTLTHDDKELVQNLSHHWAPYFDNVTRLSGSVSDALCRAVTGDGASTRKLYSDDEDVIRRYRRCVGFSSINVAAQQPDLVDRCLLIGLERITEEDRRAEEELWPAYEQMRPRLLSAALGALSRAMALLPSIRQPRLPRMADFARWGCAIAEAIGWSQQGFLDALESNARLRDEEVLESSLVAKAVIALMETRPEWDGTPSELLEELERIAEGLRINTRAKEWPGGSNALSCRLTLLQANLEAAGIKAYRRKGHSGRRIVLTRTAVAPSGGDDGDDPGTIPLKGSSRVTSCNQRSGKGRDDGDDPSLLCGDVVRKSSDSGLRTASREDREKTVTIVPIAAHGLGDCKPVGLLREPGDDLRDDPTKGIAASSTLAPKGEATARSLPDKLSRWPWEWRDLYEERAAIVEFDGGLSREDADTWAKTILREIFAKAAETEQGGDDLCGRD